MERRVVKVEPVLYVFMNGRLVGDLNKLANGAMTFQYAELWLSTTGARPLSLSLPLRRQRYEGDQVYNFFDNLLPDSKEIRARIQARFKITSGQPFDLLAAIGSDCIGSIQLGWDEVLDSVEKTTARPLANSEIARMLENCRTYPLGMDRENADFRISIAGAQEKTALLWYQEQWCLPIGTTPTSHILKLPMGIIASNDIDLSDSCENEWLCLKIAKAFGLPTANAQVEMFDEVKALVVERFDRRWSQNGQWLMRIPQEDLCQALGVSPNLKYQADGGPGIAQIMQLLLGAKNSDAAREQFFRSQILFWLLAAIDGHAKNFSIYIQPSGGYRLTPLYDIISAYPMMASKKLPKQKAKMAMAVRGTKNNYYHWAKIQSRHFVSTAQSVKFSPLQAKKLVQDMLEKVQDVTEQIAEELPANFPAHVSEPILQGMSTLARQQLSYQQDF
jgi:serine/threonine-protein kinase HipA